jgi:hypothetical protein
VAPVAQRWRPERLPLLRGTRPLKRWRYVAVFGEQLMACAARIQIGAARQSFWAVYLREQSILRERTHLLRGRDRVLLGGGALRVADAGVLLELSLREAAPVAAHCINEGGEVWTRKQAGVAAAGSLALDGGAPRAIDAEAVIDDTAGYHPRRTEWWWSAGVGRAADGRALAWNLVSGVNDPPRGSERAVWVGGRPYECPPVAFGGDLRTVECEDGAKLAFHAEAERLRKDNLLVVSSDYRAPFGTFSGTLPGRPGEGPIELASGTGVVEHHRALW